MNLAEKMRQKTDTSVEAVEKTAKEITYPLLIHAIEKLAEQGESGMFLTRWLEQECLDKRQKKPLINLLRRDGFVVAENGDDCSISW